MWTTAALLVLLAAEADGVSGDGSGSEPTGGRTTVAGSTSPWQRARVRAPVARETRLLQKISTDLEELKAMAVPECGREGLPCPVNGTWSAERAGVLFTVCLPEEAVRVSERHPPAARGRRFLSPRWVVRAASLPRAVLVLTARLEQPHHVAVFVGRCRVCSGTELLTGSWLVDRGARDCRRLPAAHLLIGDVMRRVPTHHVPKRLRCA